jgi:hypothetical protein
MGPNAQQQPVIPEGWELETPSAAGATAAPTSTAPAAAQPSDIPSGWELENPPPPPKMPLGSQLLADQENQTLAATQGTTPIIEAHKPNYLGEANFGETTDSLGQSDVGYEDKEGKFHQTDKSKHVVLRDPSDNKWKVYERTPETNEGKLSSAGRFLSQGMGAGARFGFTPAASVAENIAAGQRLGMENYPRAVSSNSPTVRYIGQALGGIPGGSPVREKTIAGVTELGKKVEEEAAKLGSATNEQAGAGLRTGYGQAFGKEGDITKQVSGAYDAVEKLVDPKATSPLTATAGAVSDITTRRSAWTSDTGKAVDMVQDAIKRPDGLTFAGVKDLRTNIGEALEKIPEGASKNELKYIYSALSEDLRSAAQNTGGAEAVTAFDRANASAKFAAAWQKKIAPVIGSDVRSNENIADSVRRMANTEGGDLDKLALTRGAVPDDVWKDVASQAMSQLGKNKKGEFSHAIFLNDWNGLSETGKNILFGKSVPFLNDIATVSKDFERAGKLANTSGTAGHLAHMGAAFAFLESIFQGDVKTPLKIVAGALGGNVLSRILSNPAQAASVAQWSRAYTTMARQPTARTLANFDLMTRNLANNTNNDQKQFVDHVKGLISSKNTTEDQK